MKIMVTGATGFIGGFLVPELQAAGHQLVLPVRKAGVDIAGIATTELQDFYQAQGWRSLLSGVEVVIHLAGRAHVMKEQQDPVALFHKANVELPLLIAQQAAAAGVRRFVFVSSIGVLGNSNTTPFTATDLPKPKELYAQSKLQAEQQLQQFCQQTGLELVIIRPPLVYGPDAPGNFGRLLQLVQKPWPLPFGAVHNQRSFVSVYNLCSLLALCAQHPKAANQLFLASDGDDVSTSTLFRQLKTLSGSRCLLVPVPQQLLRALLSFCGLGNLAVRLLDSLTVDISHTRQVLGWTPVYNLATGLRLTVEQSTSGLRHNAVANKEMQG
ncbi:NAD-dependent epimerase/dehydratase family protein [Rheinheimera sp.]|uniref:NAD-dependent epimerase/dehydratase family protein n=1 Tax=Rheinheimera sp. TaxID=1869214 RepID=UPI0027BA9A1E|nr:NAD-dependent epimerase/dehydratase family protein [Rheinheimera sp.]